MIDVELTVLLAVSRKYRPSEVNAFRFWKATNQRSAKLVDSDFSKTNGRKKKSFLSHKDFKADGTVATFVVIALKVNLFKIKVCKFFS